MLDYRDLNTSVRKESAAKQGDMTAATRIVDNFTKTVSYTLVAGKRRSRFVVHALMAFAIAATVGSTTPSVSSARELSVSGGQDLSAAKRKKSRKVVHKRKTRQVVVQAGGVNVSAAVAMISQFRRSNGLSGVGADSKLMSLARQQSQAMAATGAMSHSVAGDFPARLAQAGYISYGAAENIGVGQQSVTDVINTWVYSPSHRANLLLNGATRIGIAKAGPPNWPYWTLIIASPAGRAR
jgi:uncharacterized protein YkwD